MRETDIHPPAVVFDRDATSERVILTARNPRWDEAIPIELQGQLRASNDRFGRAVAL
jgi:hypothetical protein